VDKKHRKLITAWAVHSSRRRQMSAELKARRNARRAASGPPGFGALNLPYGGARGLRYAATSGYAASSTAGEAEAERTVRLLSERAAAARTGTTWPAGAGNLAARTATADTPAPRELRADPPSSTWSVPAIASVLIPALILLVVCLV
jgi:hypothetical protein